MSVRSGSPEVSMIRFLCAGGVFDLGFAIFIMVSI